MTAQYIAAVPPGSLVRPEIQEYFEKFYQISDTPEAHQQYSEKFTRDAKLIMASNIATGREGMSLHHRIACSKATPYSYSTSNQIETPSKLTSAASAILAMRIGMWAKVAKRSHNPTKIYAFGQCSDDVMLYGTVNYQLKDGKEALVEWSARSHFMMEDGELKMDFYQVYLVCQNT
nr:hypothetical protein CFP56_11645 [Quercus suber]